MTTQEAAEAVGARVVAAEVAGARRVERVYAGDRMSDLLREASETTLLVTNLASSQLFRVAALMDLPAICLLNGLVPEPALVAAAREHGTVLMVSPFGMFETCGRLYARIVRSAADPVKPPSL